MTKRKDADFLLRKKELTLRFLQHGEKMETTFGMFILGVITIPVILRVDPNNTSLLEIILLLVIATITFFVIRSRINPYAVKQKKTIEEIEKIEI